ncbi:DUF7281 domain-containing protein [Pedobacter alpinus]|uniref:DUF7281 domain-containing protein n=1 Tax=Pedobacter alpinus TaxID=1590643 RepID=A0ABW5TPS5_9SPHI
MKLPITIAEKLLLLENGVAIPSSKLKYEMISEMISEGILYKLGKHKSTVQLIKPEQLKLYLENRFSIKDLSIYIEAHKKENITRSELVAISSDSKLTKVRTFKGFLVNNYTPIQAKLNEDTITLNPKPGTFQFIFDFEYFVPELDVVIIGVENPENFRYIEKQKYLFNKMKPLFVSRYPQNQSKDLIKWIKSIPNNYLHFGDFDFAGIGIYLNEFKKHLSGKTQFFVPENIEILISENGNKRRYDIQKINFDIHSIEEEKLIALISTINKYKKGLDQEMLIK